MSFGGGSAPQFGERAEPGPEDHCYRHPDRVSFTLCQRCGRTICAECQSVSSVGVLCSDCVRASAPPAAARLKRSARVTPARLADREKPVVTYAIMIACAIVFAGQWLTASLLDNEVTRALWYAPLYSLPEYFEPWRMLTSVFTHSTSFLLHILFNMYALWLFGPGLERMLGRAWYLALYLLSGLGGSLGVMLWVYFAPNALAALQTPTVGASGAIFGLFMATLVAYRAHRVNVTSLAVLIGINFAIGLMPGAAISWQAHLGGMVLGALTMWAFLATRGPRLKTRRVWLTLAIAAAVVALSFAYFVVFPLSLT
ncbi:MAG: rhomboid family intramembrane serine protease [Microbacteriaceae bacterium]|nr:rhomboid family intramembrane serine protease [Microbacteriaceae bacterium]